MIAQQSLVYLGYVQNVWLQYNLSGWCYAQKIKQCSEGIKDQGNICLIHFHKKKMCFSIKFLTADDGIIRKH